MKKQNKIQKIKYFIKMFVAIGLVVLFIILVFFVKHTHTFENSNINTWKNLTKEQRVNTLQRIIPDIENQELLIDCINKISTLPESDNMMIQSAASLCYNGIKINTVNEDSEPQQSEAKK